MRHPALRPGLLRPVLVGLALAFLAVVRAGWSAAPEDAGRLYVSAGAPATQQAGGPEGAPAKALGSRAAPFSNIQAAIDAVTTEAEVVILPGTYYGGGNENITFRGKAITVRGEGGAEAVVIQDTGTDDSGARGFLFDSGETRASVLEGVTIRDFNSNNAAIVHERGGGIYIENSSPTIRECVIANNYTRAIAYNDFDVHGAVGGGIGILGSQYDIQETSPIIDGCTIEGNQSVGFYGEFSFPLCLPGVGSSMAITYATVEIVDTTIRNNVTYQVWHDCPAGSGGVSVNDALVTIRRSLITANSGMGIGGGTSKLYIYDSTVSGNDGVGIGYGVAASAEHTMIDSCTIVLNTSAGLVGALRLRNSIVSDNAQEGGGVTSLGHNIMDDSLILPDPTDMIDMNPMLGPLLDNGGPTWTHVLADGSPAIDAGDDSNISLADQRGLPRRCDGNADGVLRSDIGAFEVQGAACRSAREDLLGLLLFGIPGAPDLNDDGVVDSGDLLLSERSIP